MDRDHRELLDIFDKMSPENQANLLTYLRRVYTSQKNAKKSPGEQFTIASEAQAGKAAVAEKRMSNAGIR